MKINLSQYAGFCDGVKRAYEIIMATDIKQLKSPFFVLGSLVHNPEVIKKIEENGFFQIDREKFLNSRPGEIGTIVITAHGTGPNIFAVAEEKGIDIIDTTCPKVIKVQRLAQVYAKRGYEIIIVGDKEHKEVKGINDWGNSRAVVISEIGEVEKVIFDPSAKIVILSQTTQNEDLYKAIGEKIKEKYPQAEIILTTCNTTHFRQKEVKEMAQNNDLMVIIGSKTSANSIRLYEISKEINGRSYFIEKAEDINLDWFQGTNSIGITAGASTPQWIIKEAIDYIEKI